VGFCSAIQRQNKSILTYPIAVGTKNSHAPKNRNAGPASRFIDSTVPNLVKRPVAYSNMINGTDHSHKKPNQTSRNTNAPVGKKNISIKKCTQMKK